MLRPTINDNPCEPGKMISRLVAEIDMVRESFLEQIRALDPRRDCQRIVFLRKGHDFAFDTARALEFALYRTYCVPSISELLNQTGEFRQRPQKRYDDTDLISSELMEWGYDSTRGSAALRRMNQIHRRFAISNDDFLYVLSTFVFEPIRWNARFGWRPFCEQERLGYFYFWSEVGRRMGIQKIPTTYDDFEQFNVDYELANFRVAEANHRLGSATRDMFASWFPRLLHPVVRQSIYAMMDDRLIAAFGFPHPLPGMRRLVVFGLKLRAQVLRSFPARRQAHCRTAARQRSYPYGYRIDELGPHKAQ